MGECEVQKAELKEALVLKFEGINFGVIDLEKARALRDELIKYFDLADETETRIKNAEECTPPVTLKIQVDGMAGAVLLQDLRYDPLSDQTEYTFIL